MSEKGRDVEDNGGVATSFSLESIDEEEVDPEVGGSQEQQQHQQQEESHEGKNHHQQQQEQAEEEEEEEPRQAQHEHEQPEHEEDEDVELGRLPQQPQEELQASEASLPADFFTTYSETLHDTESNGMYPTESSGTLASLGLTDSSDSLGINDASNHDYDIKIQNVREPRKSIRHMRIPSTGSAASKRSMRSSIRTSTRSQIGNAHGQLVQVGTKS